MAYKLEKNIKIYKYINVLAYSCNCRNRIYLNNLTSFLCSLVSSDISNQITSSSKNYHVLMESSR